MNPKSPARKEDVMTKLTLLVLGKPELQYRKKDEDTWELFDVSERSKDTSEVLGAVKRVRKIRYGPRPRLRFDGISLVFMQDLASFPAHTQEQVERIQATTASMSIYMIHGDHTKCPKWEQYLPNLIAE
jgi:hypothetical protein